MDVNDDIPRYCDLWIATLPHTHRTLAGYASDVSKFAVWATDAGVDVLRATPADILSYKAWLRGQTTSKHSINRRLDVLRLFYRWLVSSGHVVADPTAGVLREPIPLRAVDRLSLGELQAVWVAAATQPSDAAVVGLLAFCCLSIDEVCRADISHLGVREGHQILRLPRRTPLVPGGDFVVLPAVVGDAVRQCVAGRTGEPLLVTRGSRRMDGAAVRRKVIRLGRRAGLTRQMQPSMLTNTGRGLAVEYGFSFAAAMQVLQSIERRALLRYLDSIHIPLDRHPAYRLARIVVLDTPETERLLGRAEALLEEGDTPPAAAVGLAGAALERHLRALTRSTGRNVNEDAATLATYGGHLRAARIMSETDVQLLTPLQKTRNDAAHGHFDRVNREIAQQFINAATRYVRAYPLR